MNLCSSVQVFDEACGPGGLGSLAVAGVALGLKLGAWWVTGSVALYSDALETVINVVAAFAALVALRISARPADSDHPYGHQKAEYLSAVIEGIMVLGAAAAIFHDARTAWARPVEPDAPLLGMAVNGLATLLLAAWATFLIRSGRAWRSPAILASGQHVLTDVWTSAGVLAGFALLPLTGWLWLDPTLAALVALNIVWTGISMVRSSVDALMDVSVVPETLAAIRRTISSNAEGAIEAHDLRPRAAPPPPSILSTLPTRPRGCPPAKSHERSYRLGRTRVAAPSRPKTACLPAIERRGAHGYRVGRCRGQSRRDEHHRRVRRRTRRGHRGAAGARQEVRSPDRHARGAAISLARSVLAAPVAVRVRLRERDDRPRGRAEEWPHTQLRLLPGRLHARPHDASWRTFEADACV